MKREEAINTIAKRIKAKRYLEIGCGSNRTFDQINIKDKTSVDKNKPKGGSDAFFADYKGDKFDLIFIDGDHLEGQVKKDFLNGLKVLATGGCIIMHDCYPASEEETAEPRNGQSPWLGGVWKVWRYVRQRKDVKSYCIADDHGIGVVWRKRHEGYNLPDKMELGNLSEWAGVQKEI